MNCLIDELLKKVNTRRKQFSVLARYLKLRYKIKVEESVLKYRAQKLKLS
ncbi:MAG: hypothetical protein ACXITV_04930 [Luteibaculaceae bacterium]